MINLGTSPVNSRISLPIGSVLRLPEEVDNSSEWIEHLKKDPLIADLYALSAGVSEGYTVEEHTRMVLEQFDRYFSFPHHLRILKNMGITKHQFGLFLALHDIGKGKAVMECPKASFIRKEKELAYCSEVIEQVVQDPRVKDIFLCLLKDDNIGDLLKQPYVTKGMEAVCVQQFAEWANELQCDPYSLGDLKILFHKIDASSYPSLRHSIFKEKDGKLNYKGSALKRIDSLVWMLSEEELTDSSYKLPQIAEIVDQILTSPKYQQFENYLELETLKTEAKNLGANREDSVVYRKFSRRLKILRERHMLPRIAAALKAAAWSSCGLLGHGDTSILKKLESKLKITPDNLKIRCKQLRLGELVEVPEEAVNKLKILEKITFLHGTNSGALALMALTKKFRLGCLGELLAQGIAPMSGEIDKGGCTFSGINQVNISTETVRDLDRVERYSRGFWFNIDKILSPLVNPYDFLMVGRSLKKNVPEFIKLTRQDLGLFQELFPSHRCELIAERLRKAIEKTNSSEYKCDWEKLLAIFESNGKNGATMDSGSDDPVSADFLNKCRFPLASKIADAGYLTPMHVRLLQVRQWDEKLFQKILVNARIQETFDHAKEIALGPANLISQIFNRKFTEEERDFITPCGSGSYPESLDDIGKDKLIKILKAGDTGVYSYDAIEKELGYCLQGTFSWNKLIQRILLNQMRSSPDARQRQAKIQSLIENTLRPLRDRFDAFEALIKAPSAAITIPQEGILRDAIEHSFPLIVASTSYQPQALISRSEYVIPEAIHFGKGGIDVLITDSEDHREKIKEMLTPELQEQISIYLESELHVGEIPLMHSQLQIKC